MRVLKRAAAIAGVALVLWSARPLRAAENETFGVSPSPDRVSGVVRRTFAIPLDRGTSFEDAVRVYNRTGQVLELLVYAADARAALDGTITVALRGARSTGVGAWIKLDRSSLSLAGRTEAIVHFRITVRSTKPSPDLGAIVVENTARGPRGGSTQRLHVVVRTTPPNSTTTSTRVHELTFRSGWLIVAVAGLIAAAVLVGLVRRRAKRSRDEVAPAGTLATADDTPEASRPVLHRLGSPDTDPKLVALGTQKDTDELPVRRQPSRRHASEEPPLLEDQFEDEEDVFEDVPKPAPQKRPARAPKREKKQESGKNLDYIPLDEL